MAQHMTADSPDPKLVTVLGLAAGQVEKATARYAETLLRVEAMSSEDAFEAAASAIDRRKNTAASTAKATCGTPRSMKWNATPFTGFLAGCAAGVDCEPHRQLVARGGRGAGCRLHVL